MALQRRHNKWRAKVRIPAHLQEAHGGKQYLQKTMTALDRPSARLEAKAWEVTIRAQWATQTPGQSTPKRILRELHETIMDLALNGTLNVEGRPEDDPRELGAEIALEKIEDRTQGRDLTPEEEVEVAALQDALQEIRRNERPAPRRELEQSFSETAAEFVEQWARQKGLKQSNTKQQKEATYRLFAGFIKDRPLRDIRRADAAAFMDTLRRFDPNWARSPKAKQVGWPELVKQFGNHPDGLADATSNRHAQALQELWNWGERRERCAGSNPFSDLRRRLTIGKNVQGYLPWQADELKRLFDPPPSRQDVTEIVLVALYTGMRLDEIASMTFDQLRKEDGIPYVQVEDAKTPAGNRQVPLHPALGWLTARTGKAGERVWPKFNAEGPGAKAGADAGKEFSRFKLARGIADRRKTFHSFRKNVTQIMERAGVPENEWAQVLGHERGFTYGRYSPEGITLAQKARLIDLIDYPTVKLPHPQ